MYNNKVFICGVDTSKLPVLKEAQKEDYLFHFPSLNNLCIFFSNTSPI